MSCVLLYYKICKIWFFLCLIFDLEKKKDTTREHYPFLSLGEGSRGAILQHENEKPFPSGVLGTLLLFATTYNSSS